MESIEKLPKGHILNKKCTNKKYNYLIKFIFKQSKLQSSARGSLSLTVVEFSEERLRAKVPIYGISDYLGPISSIY